MPISHSEHMQLICAACGADFGADVWALVDASERPDLAQALRDGALNVAACPTCGQPVTPRAPLLFHDPDARRVYFAVPHGADEHAWRERAQELLYQLLGGIPEEDRRPYLGDVQVEHEVEGVRRAILRRERKQARRRETGDRGQATAEVVSSPAHPLTDAPARPLTPPADDPAALSDAVRALLAANSESEFKRIVAAQPALLTVAGDSALRELADLSYGQGERDVAAALRELRVALAQLRVAGEIRRAPPPQPEAVTEPPVAPVEPAAAQELMPGTQPGRLSDAAYQALLRADTPDDLHAAARDYPALLDLWADDDLAACTETALDEGNERLAGAIEARREALAELRRAAGDQETLRQATQTLLEADGEDEIAAALTAHPVLLTDAAQSALTTLEADARAQGDHVLAAHAAERRTLLRTIRAGLDEG